MANHQLTIPAVPDRPMSNFGFRIMSAFIDRRNKKNPPSKLLQEARVKEGFRILDFGCGPGGHSIAAAELVGPSGKVYALDIHRLAIRKVAEETKKRELSNIETIQSDCATGLDSENLDMVFLYDIIHGLADLSGVLKELHRVLKPDAVLSVNDHHMKDEVLISKIEDGKLFKLKGRGVNFFNFRKKGGK